MTKLIAPSILSADFNRLGEEVHAVEADGADWIHADVMDGHFVPNITFGPLVVAAVRKITRLPIDVHLMIESPDRYIQAFAEAGADWISVQVETCPHLNRAVQQIKEAGAKAGVVLNPSTPLSSLDWVLEYADYVLIMSVNPGFGGQAFIPATMKKLQDLSSLLYEAGKPVPIQLDGGVGPDNTAALTSAGARILVAGSAIFGNPPYKDVIERMKKEAVV